MDGEVAQLAALVISANHRLAYPGDPMPWFEDQRAFASCGRIGFRAPTRRRFGKPRHMPVADTPAHWLELLTGSGVARVVMSCTRQDDAVIPGETLPDRIAAGFAGGGSLWTMATETGDGGALCWQPGWRAAFPTAKDGRIWEANYMAQPCTGAEAGPDVGAAAATLQDALSSSKSFAEKHHFSQVTEIFASALRLLEGGPDPLSVPRPPGPADTLEPTARRLLFAGQRGWTFDNLGLWKDQDFSADLWTRYAALSEALYSAVTTAITAAVNSSVKVA